MDELFFTETQMGLQRRPLCPIRAWRNPAREESAMSKRTLSILLAREAGYLDTDSAIRLLTGRPYVLPADRTRILSLRRRVLESAGVNLSEPVVLTLERERT